MIRLRCREHRSRARSGPRAVPAAGGQEDSEVTATLDSIVAHVPAVVAALSALHPGGASRIERGARLVAADKVQRTARVWLIGSESDPNSSYGVIYVDGVWT